MAVEREEVIVIDHLLTEEEKEMIQEPEICAKVDVSFAERKVISREIALISEAEEVDLATKDLAQEREEILEEGNIADQFLHQDQEEEITDEVAAQDLTTERDPTVAETLRTITVQEAATLTRSLITVNHPLTTKVLGTTD